jgi:hypothetical protein
MKTFKPHNMYRRTAIHVFAPINKPDQYDEETGDPVWHFLDAEGYIVAYVHPTAVPWKADTTVYTGAFNHKHVPKPLASSLLHSSSSRTEIIDSITMKLQRQGICVHSREQAKVWGITFSWEKGNG